MNRKRKVNEVRIKYFVLHNIINKFETSKLIVWVAGELLINMNCSLTI